MLIISVVYVFSGNFSIAAENEEIDFLLSFIAKSDCVFIRNGTEHQAQDASKHLKVKYNHVKSRINTAEDFIVQIASKSSLTRRRYEVLCNDVRLSTKLWLTEALESQRRNHQMQ